MAKDLSNLTETDENEDSVLDLVDTMNIAERTFNLGDGSVGQDYTPGEILREYNSFDE